MNLSLRLFAIFSSVTLVGIAGAVYGQGAGAPWVAPTAAAAKKNPLAGKPAAITAGKQIFTTTCAPCHGPSGRGDGPAAVALNPRPANFSSPAITGDSDGALFWKLSEGRGAMVAFKSTLSETQRWELVSYIRSLQGKK